MWELGLLLKAVAGGVLSVVANVVYFDMKRRGTRGFGRFLAFWFGTPFTWATFFLMKEGESPLIEPPPDDDAGLLAEVRRDRAKRLLAEAEDRNEDVTNPQEEAQ